MILIFGRKGFNMNRTYHTKNCQCKKCFEIPRENYMPSKTNVTDGISKENES